jgi:hypothetical protein
LCHSRQLFVSITHDRIISSIQFMWQLNSMWITASNGWSPLAQPKWQQSNWLWPSSHLSRQLWRHYDCLVTDSNCTVSLMLFQKCQKVENWILNQWNVIDFICIQFGNLCYLTRTSSW